MDLERLTSDDAAVAKRLVEQICVVIQSKRRLGRISKEEQILRFLGQRMPTTVSEDELTAQFFPAARGNPARVVVHQLRRDLDEYFRYDEEGRNCSIRLELVTPYRLVLLRNELRLDADEKFWDVYLFQRQTKKLILFTQPLFFWDEENRSYIRCLDINHEGDLNSEARARIQQMIGETYGARRARALVPCFHYQSCGESRALGALRRWFVSKDVNIEVAASRVWLANVRDCNSIILGNAKTNRFLAQFQSGFDFTLERDHIANHCPLKGESRKYVDATRAGRSATTGKLAFALVSRMSPASQRYATLIGANNGAAAQRAAQYVTNERNLQSLFEIWKLRNSDPVPPRFQVLIQVPLEDFDTPAGDVEVLASRRA